MLKERPPIFMELAWRTLHVAEDQERLVLAIGRYVGEGFDDQRLDTLFLTMPRSWKGTLAQYVGRLHRQHAAKTDVLVVDYVDERVPVLARMAAKRRAGCKALGYNIEWSFSEFSQKTPLRFTAPGTGHLPDSPPHSATA